MLGAPDPDCDFCGGRGYEADLAGERSPCVCRPTLPTTRPCVACGAPCRFVLCTECYHSSDGDEVADVALERHPEVLTPIPEVGLPVSVEGVKRF